MINLSKFSKMSFTEIVSLPNYYIHEIYKLFVEDAKARAKKEAEEARKRAAQERQQQRQSQVKDSTNVADLINALGLGSGMNKDDLEEILEDLE